MLVSYRITRDDYLHAVLLLNRLTPRRIAAAVSVAIVCLLFSAFGPSWFRAPALGGMLASGTALLLAAYTLLVLHRAQRQYHTQKALFEGELAIELLDAGFRVVAAHGEHTATWDRMIRWRQSDRVVLVISAPAEVRMVPKSVEAQGFDLVGLIERLNRYVGPES